jgi:thioredoxin-like negative regulator of GroEL
MEQLITELRGQRQDVDLVERLEAFTNLARGDSAEALRRLSAANRQAKETRNGQCKAALAYGVALAKVGRSEEALLEVLEGLARAREARDAAGERACLKFLNHLADSAGQGEAAALWNRAAQERS